MSPLLPKQLDDGGAVHEEGLPYRFSRAPSFSRHVDTGTSCLQLGRADSNQSSARRRSRAQPAMRLEQRQELAEGSIRMRCPVFGGYEVGVRRANHRDEAAFIGHPGLMNHSRQAIRVGGLWPFRLCLGCPNEYRSERLRERQQVEDATACSGELASVGCNACQPACVWLTSPPAHAPSASRPSRGRR